MTDLLTALREHDLPPRWDGLAVVWDDWRPQTPVFLCPPPKPTRCESCGSAAAALTSAGRVARVPAFTVEMIRAGDQTRERLPASIRHRVQPRALHRLVAFRCPDCDLDTVVDSQTHEVWVLDHTDYGPEGSRP